MGGEYKQKLDCCAQRAPSGVCCASSSYSSSGSPFLTAPSDHPFQKPTVTYSTAQSDSDAPLPSPLAESNLHEALPPARWRVSPTNLPAGQVLHSFQDSYVSQPQKMVSVPSLLQQLQSHFQYCPSGQCVGHTDGINGGGGGDAGGKGCGGRNGSGGGEGEGGGNSSPWISVSSQTTVARSRSAPSVLKPSPEWWKPLLYLPPGPATPTYGKKMQPLDRLVQ